MSYTTFVGIDISKLTLDFCIYNTISKHFLKIENSIAAITDAFDTDIVLKNIRKTKTLFCMENTGIYQNFIVEYLSKKKLKFSVPSALEIRYSLGITRGKTDKIDAERIALYAERYQDQLKQWEPKRKVIIHLHHLNNLLKKLKKIKVILKVRSNEGNVFNDKKMQTYIQQYCSNTLAAIDNDIKATQEEIISVIQSDEILNRMYDIICSVKSAGPILAATLIVVTNEFKKFQGPNQFACYAGIAPFERSSGTSLNKKPHVSRLCNREMKTLLHLNAMGAIHAKGEYRTYYERKVAENKPKMVVLNAVRNKIIKRIFSCIRDNRLYEDLAPHNLAHSK